MQGVVFVDWGAAFSGDLSGSEMKMGRGIGVRFFTPLAPIRFDYGLGEDNSFILHFGLGQLF